MKNFLVTIVGPTAVGKTRLSIKIAQHFSTHVISADARQFYRDLNIGTAKPSAEELSTVPHHFIGHLAIDQLYSAGDFEKDALPEIEKLFSIHNVLVLTGGSGLFIDAVLKGLDKFPDVDPKIRRELNLQYAEKGIAHLQQMLLQKDPSYHAAVDLSNPRRLIRALEVTLSTGKSYSSFLSSASTKRNFIPIKIGLKLDMDVLYRRIDSRVDAMMSADFLAEVKSLRKHHEHNSMQTVGYVELLEYLNGAISLEDAVKLIKQHTRNYAKRQMTWFRKDKEITWFGPEQEEQILKFVEGRIAE